MTGIGVVAEMRERRRQSVNYFQHREISGTCCGTGCEKSEEGRSQGWLLAFWLEWELVSLSFTKQTVWVQVRLGAWRKRLHQEFPSGHLKLLTPETWE